MIRKVSVRCGKKCTRLATLGKHSLPSVPSESEELVDYSAEIDLILRILAEKMTAWRNQ